MSFSRALQKAGLARLAAVVLLVFGLGFAVAACGSSDSDSDSGDSSGQTGGEITISQTSQPDFLDPALSYTVNGWEPMWLVYTPLLTYPHVEGTAGGELIPGLAEELPTVTNGGKTYKLKLRDGLKYSDGQPVVASDFEHTIKRVLNLESGGSFFYENIVGADEYLKNGDPQGEIKGITTNDNTGEITIDLVSPDASFSNILAMNFAGLVPGDTPFKNMTDNPPAGVGSYMITESVPNRQFVMEKSPNFADFNIPDIPVGSVDKITTEIIKNANQQAQDVLSNKLDYMQDPPPADLKPTVEQQAGDRYSETTTGSTYYFFMNTRVAPFDDAKVREAVNYGIDKPGLARIFAGELAPGCSFLPPGMPGYNEAFDTTDCPYGDPSQPPDLEKAKQLIKEAGAEGAKVTVWGNNDDPSDKVTEAYTDMLNQMGLDASPKILDGGVYFQTIGNQSTKAQTGFANWFQDFPHPLNFSFLVNGESIQPTNNQNFGNVENADLDKEVAELTLEPDLSSVADRWEAWDEALVSPPNSYIAPYGHRKLSTFVSDRIDFDAIVFHPLYNNDYSTFKLK
jgi:peptide/nickel transport system substrate-binding protein